MNRISHSRSVISHVICFGVLVLPIATSTQSAFAQAKSAKAAVAHRALPSAVEKVLIDANRASMAELKELEQAWRTVFRNARQTETLQRFVSETLDIFEKLQQVQDLALNPGATEARVGALFRKRIMDESTVCHLLEQSLNDYCQSLDQQDQALLIKLKIDREVGRTKLSRSVLDPAAFKRPIHTAVSSAVTAVQNDISRSIATFVASEAISFGVKKAARELGMMPEQGSVADFFGGLLIDIGVSVAVDAATDPTDGMVTNLQQQLATAERDILDGSPQSPGFLSTLKRITEDRATARRKLLEAELLK